VGVGEKRNTREKPKSGSTFRESSGGSRVSSIRNMDKYAIEPGGDAKIPIEPLD
jgi:hypothetical protein